MRFTKKPFFVPLIYGRVLEDLAIFRSLKHTTTGNIMIIVKAIYVPKFSPSEEEPKDPQGNPITRSPTVFYHVVRRIIRTFYKRLRTGSRYGITNFVSL